MTLRLGLVLICFINSTGLLFSQWNSNTAINTPVILSTKSQQNIHTIPDTKGGAILTWEDNRNSATNSTDIYAQRLKSNGFSKWASNGIVICNDAALQNAVAIADGGIDGSAIITWEDNRTGNSDIYVQKVDSSGNVLWTANGVVVCNKTTSQKNPKVVSDNSGGAIIVWEDSLNFYWDVYAQRINASGVPLWTANGVAICTAMNAQINPKIDVDGLGGSIMTWQDKRNGSDYDIYSQRIDANGAVQWTTDGVVICNAVNTQNNPRIEPDGANGALIAWVDKRNGIDYNIYAQRINSTGTIQWAANGVVVCNAINNQSALDMKYLGSNGLLLTWKDERAGAIAIYTQLLNMSGAVQLPTNGTLLSNSLKSINPNNISDGSGGAIVVWQDSTAIGWNIKTQKLNSSGAIQWSTGGLNVCTTVDDQINATQTTDGNGGAIYFWEDRRNGSDYDIYAHHLAFDVGIDELSAAENFHSICFPNPVTSSSKIKLLTNPSGKDWEISIYDSFGKFIKQQTLSCNEIFEIGNNEFSEGVYFYYLTLTDKSFSTKGSFVTLKN